MNAADSIDENTSLRSILARIRAAAQCPVDAAISMPPEAYVDPDLLQLERQAIFRSEWICIGRSDEIASVGAYLTAQIDSTPILVARQKDGSIRSFANVCSHRAMVLAEGCGTARRFTCPYHGWTFDLGGELLAAPLMAEDFCKTGHGLIELRTETVLGFVFVTLSEDANSIEETLRPLSKRLAPFQVERMRTLRKDVLHWNCNWKIAVENGIEPYHITATHTATLAPYAAVRNVVMEEPSTGYHAYDHRFDDILQVPESAYYIPNTSGNQAIREYAVAGCIFPNMAFSVAFDWVWWITCQPEGIGRVRIDHGVAGPFDLGGADPNLDDPAFGFLNIDTAFMPEDVPRVEGVQRGAESGFARQSSLSPLEGTVHGFISHYSRLIEAALDQSGPASQLR